jgi:hypothetical protein
MPSLLVQRTKEKIVKFAVGDQVYVRPRRYILASNSWEELHEYDEPMTVVEVTDHLGWPHYRIEDDHGGKWLVSQLELSTSSFTGVR